MADQFYSGKYGSVNINGVEVPVKNWKFTDGGTELDVTNTTSGGFYKPQGGIRKGSGSFEMDFDVTDAYTPTDLHLSFGQFLTNALLTVGKTGPTSATPRVISCPSVMVLNVEYSNEVEGIVTVSVPFVTDGSFTMPAV